ncbi:MAG TPA: phosphatidylglycerol lysyltransferase domain-containing protein [Geminicoccus sp.]|uniref:phosphatidylglycerol lysyltransferase domain-containing protein n=1 Tax=Geminicoccus sp. TaxID=2024832 RepID=UPI002E2F23F8|nr:phosphatidylglycerol lysyltransferase domain-containing protein [Geminicoccus sp.]HEX2528628.1 phosphatidylglycerol lysyltransferase domain-containing protein [Geminicoccus sp.]
MTLGIRQRFLRLATSNGRRVDAPPFDGAVERLVPLLQRARDGLVLTGDKQVLTDPGGRTAIAFARHGATRIALGSAFGDPDQAPALVRTFLADARLAGERAAFYAVTPDELPLLLGPRLVATKLGERAIIDLPSFTLKGPRFQNLRTRRSKLAREGWTIELVEGDALRPWLQPLASVSSAWLERQGGREKRFSLGAFDPAYLLRTEVLLAHREGEVAAFLNLVRARRSGEVLIDLMRVAPEAPHGCMEALIAEAALLCRARGDRKLDLGCAPLAGLPSIHEAPFWGRLGRLMSRAGRRWYDFQGLRTFKEKFHPDWEPVYLVHHKGALLPTLRDTALLIAGGWTGLVGRRAA